MHKPKVSVVTAIWNDEASAASLLDAVIAQTFKDWEIILVDDNSEDRTLEILKKYAQKDSRIRVFHNEKWMERCYSRNRALKEAKGEYIAINDGDDIPIPKRLEREVKYLDEHPECYLVASRAYINDENGNRIGKSWGIGRDSDITEYMEEENRIVHSSVMYRNTGEFKYREKFLRAQDYDLFLQMMASGKRIHLLNDFLVSFETKKDLTYSDDFLKQIYSAEMAKYIFRKKKYEGIDIYDTVDENNPIQYAPKKLILEMNMKRAFFRNDFKEARKIAKELIKEDRKILWICFYIDTFFNGILYKMMRWLKRSVLY